MTSLVPGTNPNSSASSTRSALERKVADFLGYTIDSDNWSEIQKDRLESIIDKGYHEYLYPPRINPNEAPHRWGFLRGTYTFSTVANQSDYDLPHDLAYITSSVTFTGQPRYYESYVRLAGWGDLKVYRTASSGPDNGLPLYYAVDMSLSNAPGSAGTDKYIDNFWYYEDVASSLPVGSDSGNTSFEPGYYFPVHLTEADALEWDQANATTSNHVPSATTHTFHRWSGSYEFYLPSLGTKAMTADASGTALNAPAGWNPGESAVAHTPADPCTEDANAVIPADYLCLRGYLTSPDLWKSSLPSQQGNEEQPRLDTGNSAGKISFYPTPDKVYEIIFQYQRGSRSFASSPLGPDEFHLLLEECVLSHAEKELNDAYGIHRQSYMELLDRFIEHDKRMYPEEMLNLGQMRDYPFQTQHGQYSSRSDPRAFLNQFTITHANRV